MTERVNEKSTSWLSVSFTDKDGAPEVPTQVNYQIDDITKGVTSVLADTVFGGGLAATIEIEITSAQNAILNQSNDLETRCVTITAAFGGAGQQIERFVYNVVNLKAVT